MNVWKKITQNAGKSGVSNLTATNQHKETCKHLTTPPRKNESESTKSGKIANTHYITYIIHYTYIIHSYKLSFFITTTTLHYYITTTITITIIITTTYILHTYKERSKRNISKKSKKESVYNLQTDFNICSQLSFILVFWKGALIGIYFGKMPFIFVVRHYFWKVI